MDSLLTPERITDIAAEEEHAGAAFFVRVTDKIRREQDAKTRQAIFREIERLSSDCYYHKCKYETPDCTFTNKACMAWQELIKEGG